jgi:4-hydroxy-tetrahydrodipicolinate reductase
VVHFGDRKTTLADTLGVPADVLIDVSLPDGTMEWLKVCERLEIPMVTGVTGHSAHQIARIREAARLIPIVQAFNFSVVMRAMVHAVGALAGKLGSDHDIEIVETHHRQKADAPSGSAKTLLRAILDATGGDEEQVVFGREGQVGQRPKGQIGVHAVRMGEVVGWHEVHFAGTGEILTIRHTVQSRDPFAAGALRAAVWVINQPPGIYSIDNVIDSGVA